MIRVLIVLLVLGCVSLASSATTAQDSESGDLVIVGGGGTPDVVMEMLVEICGDQGSIVVIPQASSRADAGEGLVEFFESFGAKNVESLDIENPEQGVFQLEQAKVIWIGGGNQNALMEKLPDSIIQQLKRSHQKGATLGGTSAGAAVMSNLMITGDADLKGVHADSTKIGIGLGLTDLIVDQHFHRRQRFNRLLGAVLDHPDKVGVGIDERTAIILSKNQMRVVGESSVLIVDATQATVGESKEGQDHSATGVQLHLLASGQVFELPAAEDRD